MNEIIEEADGGIVRRGDEMTERVVSVRYLYEEN